MLSRIARAIIACLVVLSFGCARQQTARDIKQPRSGEIALAAAWNMIGRPYQYTGDSPEGFDCSGLVAFCYHSAGLELPHSTGELKQIAHIVPFEEMRKGDLLFFEENGRKYSHVGIYAGNGKFIHAARSRNSVRIDSILDPYWKERLLDARRF